MTSERENELLVPLSARRRSRPGPEGGKRDSNRRRRVAALQDAALELFLQKGVEGATIAEITSGANTAKGSFYHYFQDKADLVEALFAPLSHTMEEAFEEAGENLAKASTPEELMRAYNILGMRVAPGVLQHPKIVLLYLQECRGASTPSRRAIETLREGIDANAIKLTHAAHRHGLWRSFPAQISAYAVVGAVEKSLFSLLRSEANINPAEWTRSLISLILDGLAPR